MTAPDHGLEIRAETDAVVFWIHVSPRARRAGVGGARNGALRVAVSAPPVEGQANEACVAALARALGMARGRIELDPGSRSRRKRVLVRTDDPKEAVARLRQLAEAPETFGG